MFPDEEFAPSVGSFPSPVAPPTVDPDASPGKTVTIACQWLPFVRGALQQLLLQATWDTDAAGLALVQGRVFNLIDLFQECSSNEYPFACPADFTYAQGLPDWSALTQCGIPFANWIPTLGWDYVDGCSPNHSREVYIGRPLSGVKLTEVIARVNWQPGPQMSSSNVAFGVYWDGGHHYTAAGDMPGSGTDLELLYQFATATATSQIKLDLTADYEPGNVPLGGYATIRSVTLVGVSSNPQGPGGCF